MSLIMGAPPGEGRHDPAPPQDVTGADYESVSIAISRLPHAHCSVIIAVYVHGSGKTLSRVARDINMHHETLKRKLEEIHILLEPVL